MQPDNVLEWKWVLNRLWYSLAVLIVRWILPMGIRQACCIGEAEVLADTYPPYEEWDFADLAEFATNLARIERQYGASLSRPSLAYVSKETKK